MALAVRESQEDEEGRRGSRRKEGAETLLQPDEYELAAPTRFFGTQ